ncbi:2000_t:CDS:2 [Acaulospora morrowiae]|uniref:2000_t:CDS:1 n=1 Tax=Acaulospora morrowiae TaxID=94023 RepID=A0A9N9GAZ6_9GLOM|nr:2000_t:CDS:2 [Acaulospora morrowiae]
MVGFLGSRSTTRTERSLFTNLIWNVYFTRENASTIRYANPESSKTVKQGATQRSWVLATNFLQTFVTFVLGDSLPLSSFKTNTFSDSQQLISFWIWISECGKWFDIIVNFLSNPASCVNSSYSKGKEVILGKLRNDSILDVNLSVPI